MQAYDCKQEYSRQQISNNHLQYTREKNEWDKKEGEKRSVELDSKKERNILLNSIKWK